MSGTKRTTLSPARFAYERLGLRSLYGWNIEALEAVARGEKTVVRAANGSGKTTMLVAPLILWFLSRYPQGRIPITSGSFRQIDKQLWPALNRFKPLFPHWTWNHLNLKTPEGGEAIGFSTSDGFRAEGWHPTQGPDIDPVLWIVDEAKNVPEETFQAVDRCTRQMQLFVSSPGQDSGQFYRSFHSEAKYFKGIRATYFECPHIEAATPGKYIQDCERYGKDSALVRSMHHADFTALGNEVILSPTDLRIAQETPNAPYTGAQSAFCDFAAGGDENVIAIKNGNKVTLVDAWADADTMAACDKFISIFSRFGLSPGQIYGDNSGLGHVMIDSLREKGWPINRVDNGSVADDPHYYNRGSEIWFRGAREIRRNLFAFEGIDKIAFDQLTSRRVAYKVRRGDDKALLWAEGKPQMQERGIGSPDRADAIMGCIACGANYHPGVVTARGAEGITVPQADFVRTTEVF